MSTPPHNAASVWPHRWAWVLVCAVFPLIWMGALVTTTDAGMAFRDWMTSDGTFFLFYNWLASAGDKFVEHGHRLLGAAAGVLSIVLLAVTWRCEERPWVRRFAVAILAAVIGQGVLGGMRVVLDERTLAMIHGCTGPLFFSMCAAMVVFTSKHWAAGKRSDARPGLPTAGRVAWACTALAYCQLVVGALVRHSPMLLNDSAGRLFQIAVYFHIILALALTLHVFWLATASWRVRSNRALGTLLGLLITTQLGLGLATWVAKYGMPHWATQMFGEFAIVNSEPSTLLAAIVTSHVAVGSLILVLSLATALRMTREAGGAKRSFALTASGVGGMAV